EATITQSTERRRERGPERDREAREVDEQELEVGAARRDPRVVLLVRGGESVEPPETRRGEAHEDRHRATRGRDQRRPGAPVRRNRRRNEREEDETVRQERGDAEQQPSRNRVGEATAPGPSGR